MKKQILAILFTFVGAAMLAGVRVTCTIVDDETKESVPYATIKFQKKEAPDSSAILMVSDDNGAVIQELPAAGDWQMLVTSVGKASKTVDFTAVAGDATVDLGRVALKTGVELQEVNVVAQKPLVKTDIDKISYDVENDPDSKTQTAIKLLRKVPMVTVDGQDNITINGSSNFKVYVNGKPNTMMSNNPKEVLKSLPASSIKSIEVITDPGAKYDAEGTGGILNIVTSDMKIEGYSLTLGATMGTDGPQAYAYGTTQAGKFTVSGNYSYNHSKTLLTDVESRTEFERRDFTADGVPGNILRMSQESASNPRDMHWGSLEASYEIDTLNLVSLSFSAYGFKSKSNDVSRYSMTDGGGQPLYSYSITDPSRTSSVWLSGGLDYQHSFKKKGEFLTLSYKYDNTPHHSDGTTLYGDADGVPFSLVDIRQDVRTNNAEHTFQLDYVNPITGRHYVDAGMKFIARKNLSDNKQYTATGDGTMDYDSDRSEKYNQQQNILAAYADYRLTAGKLGLKAGARYEHTFVNVTYKYRPEQDFDKGYDNVVPTVSMSWNFRPTSIMKVMYNMRINRPSIFYLNPFRQVESVNSVSYGNPDLAVVKDNTLQMSYSYSSMKFNINTSLGYNFVNDGIEAYSFVNDGVLNRTYGNIVERKSVNLSVWLNWNISLKTRFMLNSSVRYSDMRSDVIGSRHSGWTTFNYAHFSQTLPWKLQLFLYGGYGLQGLSLQSGNSSFHFYGVNLQRQFLKDDRLTVSLNASDFLRARKTYKADSFAASYTSHSQTSYYSPRFSLSLSWRLGSLNASVKKANRSIENDDLMKGGGDSKTGQQQ